MKRLFLMVFFLATCVCAQNADFRKGVVQINDALLPDSPVTLQQAQSSFISSADPPISIVGSIAIPVDILSMPGQGATVTNLIYVTVTNVVVQNSTLVASNGILFTDLGGGTNSLGIDPAVVLTSGTTVPITLNGALTVSNNVEETGSINVFSSLPTITNSLPSGAIYKTNVVGGAQLMIMP